MNANRTARLVVTVKSALIGTLLLGSLLAPLAQPAAATPAVVPSLETGSSGAGGLVLGVQQDVPDREERRTPE